MANITHQFAEKVNRSGFLSGLAGVEYRSIELDITEENLNAGDEWHFIKLPNDAIVLDVFLGVDELDAGNTMTLNLGLGASADEFLAADVVARTGGTVHGVTGANLPHILVGAPADIESGAVEGDGPFLGEVGTSVFATVVAAPGSDDAQEGKAVLTIGYIRTRQR